MGEQKWVRSDTYGWADRDGPRPPAAPNAFVVGGLGGTLAVTLAGILGTDTLCPEHRVWVQSLASVALAFSVAAVVQVLRREASAVWFAGIGSVLGVAIGVIDAVHAPERGRLVALGFGLAAVASLGLAARMWRLRVWDRELALAHRAGPGDVVADRSQRDAPVADRSGPERVEAVESRPRVTT